MISFPLQLNVPYWIDNCNAICWMKIERMIVLMLNAAFDVKRYNIVGEDAKANPSELFVKHW
jgi:hypothetical protein